MYYNSWIPSKTKNQKKNQRKKYQNKHTEWTQKLSNKFKDIGATLKCF